MSKKQKIKNLICQSVCDGDWDCERLGCKVMDNVDRVWVGKATR